MGLRESKRDEREERRQKREERGEKETKKVMEITVFKDQNVLRDQVGHF